MRCERRQCWNCLFHDYYFNGTTCTCCFKLDEYGYPERMFRVTVAEYRYSDIAQEYETVCEHFVDKEEVINRERDRILGK